jgi:hypothetical protein
MTSSELTICRKSSTPGPCARAGFVFCEVDTVLFVRALTWPRYDEEHSTILACELGTQDTVATHRRVH